MDERRTVRQPSGWRYVLIGALTFLFAASLLTAGLCWAAARRWSTGC